MLRVADLKSNTGVAENPQGNFRACPPPCANGSAVADIHQSMTMGLAHYHPMNAHFAFYATGYAWRSVVTTGLVLAWDVRNDTAAERRTLALAVAVVLACPWCWCCSCSPCSCPCFCLCSF
eukprot:COSAG04_NODE_1284_length_7376_cov_4.157345_13_plen_120_part_01